MKNILLLIPLVFHGMIGLSQGLNNPYEIDSTDIENSLDLLGIEVYKFPIYSKDTAYLNVIIEEYKSDTLFNSYDHIESLEGISKKYLNDVSMLSTPDTSWFRVYFHRKDESNLTYRFNYKSISIDFMMDDLNKMDDGTRAYDFESVYDSDGKPILIWYGSTPSGDWRHCPGGIPLDQVVKRYDRVIAFKLELVKIE